MLDDAPLRGAACADLLAQAAAELPAVAMALQAVERGLALLTVEIALDQDGFATCILCDETRGDRETLLVEMGPDTGEQLPAGDRPLEAFR